MRYADEQSQVRNHPNNMAPNGGGWVCDEDEEEGKDEGREIRLAPTVVPTDSDGADLAGVHESFISRVMMFIIGGRVMLSVFTNR